MVMLDLDDRNQQQAGAHDERYVAPRLQIMGIKFQLRVDPIEESKQCHKNKTLINWREHEVASPRDEGHGIAGNQQV